ncbi:MAG: hypothetical protein EOO18_00725 [Chryseobacterium sp.]|nr:MAG: hypothetical protein EOO18_00725 [Chryseobacterium sp.]
MIQKTTLYLTHCIVFLSLLLFTEANLHAQAPSISPQQVAFERICAGDIVDGVKFNQYFVTYTYLNFPAGAVFEAQLSDEFGDFTNPTATTTLETVQITATQQRLKFAVPTNLKGSDSYSLRIISTNNPSAQPSQRVKNFSNKTTFSAYYMSYVNSFFINNKDQNATICSGGNLTLSVYNPTPEVPESSPANNSNLKYKWYKDEVLIAGQSGSSVIVSSTGVYYAEIDYGFCTSENISSNRVTVTSSSSGSAVTVTSSLGNPFCSNGSGTILTATSGNSYVWKKNGVVIPGVTTRTYTANDAGIYTVEVDFGGCIATGSIDLKVNGFSASIDVPDTYELKEGETLSVSLTTDATTPTIQWYLNNNPIDGATTLNYLVSVRGNYKVIISQAAGCVASREFNFRITSELDAQTSVIPNIVNLKGNYPYWNVPDVYKTNTTKIIILSSNGEVMYDDVGSNYDPEFNSFIKDFKNVNPVYYYVIQSDTGEKKGSITVIK